MQILILGMHRSGTSVVARLLNMMGVYFAPEGVATGANEENPKGFWERRDVRNLNDMVLHSAEADWHRLGNFSLAQIPEATLARFQKEARKIILELDAHRPWFLKEPRCCILAPLWLELLECPVALLVYRSPAEVARSLEARNGFPLCFGLALWERYYTAALNATLGMRRLQVNHARLMADPVATVRDLHQQLGALGVRGVSLPSNEEILGFLDPSLYRAKEEPSDSTLLTEAQQALQLSFQTGESLLRTEPLPLSEEAQQKLREGDYWIKAQQQSLARSPEAGRLANELARSQRALENQRLELERQKDANLKQRRVWEDKLKSNTILIHRREGQILELRETCKRHRTELDERHQQIGSLREALNERDRQIASVRSSLATESARVVQLTDALTANREQIEILQDQLAYLTRANRFLKKTLGQIEKSCERLRHSRSFHFIAYTMRRLGLVSRTPRVCVEAIANQLKHVNKVLREIDKSRLAARTETPITPPPSNPANARPAPETGAAPNTTDYVQVSSPAVPSARQASPSPIIALPLPLRVDVIVCVHNAPDDVRNCLESILAHPSYRLNQLLLVNDGSDESTTSYLHSFKTRSPIKTTLLENPAPGGYTKAANRGLAASEADFAILLNSDTIVTPGWIERLMACAEVDSAIGIVGPLSNAASWQSVPKRFATGGDWAVNDLDLSLLDRIATTYSASFNPQYPRVSIVNGFCFAIKRKVMDAIGLLDELAFPRGYGEENDYCFRAAQAGFSLAIADDCYVFHAKSKSYSHERRRELAEQSGLVLRQRYGAEIDRATKALRNSAPLAQARSAFSQVVEAPPVSILFLMHFRGFGGGISSIVQEANGLKELGVAVQIAIRLEDAAYYRNRFPTIPPNLFFPFRDTEELIAYAGSFEIVVATLFTGVRLLKEVLSRFPAVAPCYYIQDYEPNFFPEGDAHRQEALESYTLIPTLHRFAKTRWLCDFIAHEHNVSVSKVEPSLDRRIFFAAENSTPNLPLIICAMVRPHTAYRSPELTFKILRQIKLEQGDRVEIQMFGLLPDDPFLEKQPNDFPYQVLGILNREAVAEVLRRAFLFIDASTYQAFGRSGLEAMACGCATILPATGGSSEYAVDGINTLLATPGDFKDVLTKTRQYIDDPELHRHIVKRGLETACRYSVQGACASELKFFKALRPCSKPGPTFRPNALNSFGTGSTPPNKGTRRSYDAGNAKTVTGPFSDFKFRITILSSTTNIHGGTKRLLNIAQRLQLRGHHVTFVTHHSGRELDWFDLNAPLRKIRFDENTPLREIEHRLPDADILLTYGNNRSAQLLRNLSRRKGKKYLLFMHFGVHDRTLDERNAALPEFCKFTTTNWIVQELGRLGTIATPIGFGVDADQFYPIALPRAFRVGTLLHKDDWKRSADVIEAFKIVRQRLPRAQLVAFGQVKNPQLDVECEYHFDPSQEKLREIYSSCSAWVTSSLWEGVGMCSVEAMLCKTPLITTDTGGSRDFCTEENSVRVEKQCPPSIALALIHVLTHPGYAARLAERAYVDINSNNWDRSIDRLESEFLKHAREENPTVVANRKYELTIGIHAAQKQSTSLANCLASLYQNTLNDFEIVVVDDATDTETHTLIRNAYLADPRRLRYVRNRNLKGLFSSYNQVLSTARGRYTFLIHAGAVLSPGWDRNLIAVFRAHGDMILIGPAKVRETSDCKQSPQGLVTSQSGFPSSYLAVDSQLIGRIGFFNEQLRSPEEIEAEYIDRAQAVGYGYVGLDDAGVRRQDQPASDVGGSAAEKKPAAEQNHLHPAPSTRRFAVTDKRIAFIYNGKFTSSTRKRTFEIARSLQRYATVATFYLPEVTESVYSQFDVFILQRIGGLNETFPADVMKATFKAIERNRAGNKLFLYDIDDFVFDAHAETPRRLMRACDGVIASTPHLQRLAQMENARTIYLKNGVDYDRFFAAPPASLDPRRFHIVCASLGAVGQTLLAQIAHRLHPIYPDIELHLFRDANYCDTPSNIRLHPPVALDELFGYMKSADVVVNFDWPDAAYREQLQRQYGLSPEQLGDFVNSKSALKYYNAGLAEKAFISTRQPAAYAELIEHGVNGFIADSADEFAEIIIKLRQDPTLKSTLGARAFEDVIANYTLEGVVFDYIDAFSRTPAEWPSGGSGVKTADLPVG